jgi:hypothetical protein
MPDPLMGFALQSFPPLAQSYAVTSTAPLLTLGPPAKPHDRESTTSQTPRMYASRTPGHHVRPAKLPPPSGSCSARESATDSGVLDPNRRRSSPGPSSPPGFSPPLEWPGFPRASPHAVAKPNASVRTSSATGSRFQRDRLAPNGAADPPGVLRLAPSPQFEEVAIRESPPQSPGYVAAPCGHL